VSDRPYVFTQKLLKHGYVSSRLTNSTVVITNWLTFTNVHFSYGNESFPIYLDFSFFYHGQNLYQSWLWVTREASYKTQELPTVRQHLCSPCVFFVGATLLVLLAFCFVLYFVCALWIVSHVVCDPVMFIELFLTFIQYSHMETYRIFWLLYLKTKEIPDRVWQTCIQFFKNNNQPQILQNVYD
jgi:hypothetical protein